MKKKVIFLIVLALLITTVFGVTGFDSKNTLAAAAPVVQKVGFTNAVCTASGLNVRQGPATSFPIVCMIKRGQTVKVIGKIGNWYVVYEPIKRCVGAASGSYLKAALPTTTSTGIAKPAPAPTAKPAPAAPIAGISPDEQTLLNLVNKARADAGVKALKFDMALVKVARLKAKDMVDKGYFGHTSPTYGSPFAMMRQYGISFNTAGENIAGNQTVDGAFRAWMGSPGHKNNILNSRFNFSGIGMAKSPTYGVKGKIIVEQFIGR